MSRQLVLFLIFIVLILPNRHFAQIGQTPLQNGDICKASKLHLQIKLTNGETIKGEALEINNQGIKLCRDGMVETIPRQEISEVKNRQTAGQRLAHVTRVIGFAITAIVVFAFIARQRAIN